jgi:hypothetical protein
MILDTVDPDAGGLAEGTTRSFEIVGSSLWNSVLAMLRYGLPLIAAAAVLALVIFLVVTFVVARAELRAGRAALDPRPLVDPLASDVLGEW